MKSNENSEGGNFHHLLSCHLARERFRTFSTLFLTDNKYEIIISGPPKSVPISQITSCLLVYKCQTCRQKPKCNIWQWPFIWKKKQVIKVIQSSYQVRNISKLGLFSLGLISRIDAFILVRLLSFIGFQNFSWYKTQLPFF